VACNNNFSSHLLNDREAESEGLPIEGSFIPALLCCASPMPIPSASSWTIAAGNDMKTVDPQKFMQEILDRQDMIDQLQQQQQRQQNNPQP
jgi:hypothetical protein